MEGIHLSVTVNLSQALSLGMKVQNRSKMLLKEQARKLQDAQAEKAYKLRSSQARKLTRWKYVKMTR